MAVAGSATEFDYPGPCLCKRDAVAGWIVNPRHGSQEVRPARTLPCGPASSWGGAGPFQMCLYPILNYREVSGLSAANAIRKLEDYEEVGLIGYPCDGDYIAVVGAKAREDWLLGGELCGLNGAVIAEQRRRCHAIIRKAAGSCSPRSGRTGLSPSGVTMTLRPTSARSCRHDDRIRRPRCARP